MRDNPKRQRDAFTRPLPLAESERQIRSEAWGYMPKKGGGHKVFNAPGPPRRTILTL